MRFYDSDNKTHYLTQKFHLIYYSSEFFPFQNIKKVKSKLFVLPNFNDDNQMQIDNIMNAKLETNTNAYNLFDYEIRRLNEIDVFLKNKKNNDGN